LLHRKSKREEKKERERERGESECRALDPNHSTQAKLVT
jgi:hypothetical protein